MTGHKLDGTQVYNLFLNGYLNLKHNMQTIDELNVFPVPDGDTGKNMTATIEGGVAGSNKEETNVGTLMESFSRNTLLAARGNSGVILSQFVRGIAKGTKGKNTITVEEFLYAIKSGVNSAYKSVVKPVEGTMLTVMREGCENTIKQFSHITDINSCLQLLVKNMKKSLKNTPELLPILKEAGVVDSGGAGILCIFEGMLMSLSEDYVPFEDFVPANNGGINMNYDPEELLTYGYCTEFILQLQKQKTDISAFNIQDMITYLEGLGNSIVAVNEDTIVKVHVHTFEPEKVIAYARTFGELVTIKIENMAVSHNDSHTEAAVDMPKEKYAVLCVASGEGIINYFMESGATAVVDGGQTNNPSAEDFVAAFKKINAEHIIVLPNNSNIVMTAEQAGKMYKDAEVHVIKTKSIAEGYSALSMMDLSLDTVEDVISEMTCYLSNVTTGYVTTATRDAFIDGIEIFKDDYIGLTNDTIMSDCPDKIEAAISLLKNLPDIDDKQVVTAFCGKDVTDEEKNNLCDALLTLYPMIEIGTIDGMQEVYSFIFAIE